MDALSKQSRETQVVIGGTALFVILSFFNWQSFKVEIFGQTVGGSWSLWHGLGVIAALVAIALLAWEVARLLDVKLDSVASPALVSVALAGVLVVVTIVKFLQANEGRAWPAWVGLLLSIVIAVFAWKRGQDEGVQMPDISAARASGSTSTSSPPPAAAPAAPVAPEPPAAAPHEQEPPAPV
ncbi:MAG TPA: hypothetical protein VFB41_00735 [Solirubrobacteraceae bacterium]|nr:hypothetical protein [Solirubrobacteraceae bacterium]